MYFYELHEGDEDAFSDLLLVHEEQYEPEDFFDLVQSVRVQVQDTYEDDTLIEAIAAQLEREHGFVFVNDDRLTAAVNVSTVDEENVLIVTNDDEDRLLADDGRAADYRAVIAEFDPDGEARSG